jgi:hypothetical protein
MRGDDELRRCLNQLVDGAQCGELAVGRPRCLGFVQQVDAVAAQLVEQNAMMDSPWDWRCKERPP